MDYLLIYAIISPSLCDVYGGVAVCCLLLLIVGVWCLVFGFLQNPPPHITRCASSLFASANWVRLMIFQTPPELLHLRCA